MLTMTNDKAKATRSIRHNVKDMQFNDVYIQKGTSTPMYSLSVSVEYSKC